MITRPHGVNVLAVVATTTMNELLMIDGDRSTRKIDMLA